MPRPTKAPAVVEDHPTGPNSVVASAARVSGRRNIPRTNALEWQAEAWQMFDEVGELAAVAGWKGNALSRVELVVKRRVDGTELVVDTGEAALALAALYDGPSGQSQMMGAFGVHLEIPGETWLVGVAADPYADPPRLKDWWRVMSNQEVKRIGNTWEIERGDGNKERWKAVDDDQGPAEAFVLRIWDSHPAKWVEANSPVRAALPILRELVGLTKHVAANIDSRLAGAGLLAIPSEMTFSSPQSDSETPGDADADEFISVLTEAMMKSITDRGNASALVPIVVKAPGQFLAAIQHITFSSELDTEARELRNEAIRRLALSMDIPPEVLTGMSDANHWNAWLVTEEAIRIHIEPMVELITSALTTEYLWPLLVDANVEDPTSYVIEGDTSKLRVQQSHEASAQALWSDLRITDEALIREVGLEETDILLPGTEEYRRRVLEKLAASGVPEVVVYALQQLGVVVPDLPAAGPVAEAPGLPPAATEDPAVPAIEAPREPPSGLAASGFPETPQSAALLVGAELMIFRALERANNRLNNRRKGPLGPVPEHALDAALKDAWTQVPRAAALCGVEPAELLAACDAYARDRLATAQAHDPMALLALLRPLIGRDDDAA